MRIRYLAWSFSLILLLVTAAAQGIDTVERPLLAQQLGPPGGPPQPCDDCSISICSIVPPDARIWYFGGRVLESPEIYSVLYGSVGTYIPQVTGPEMAQFYREITGEGYQPGAAYVDWVAEYSTAGVCAPDGSPGTGQTIGRGAFKEKIVIVPSAANNGDEFNQIKNTDIEAEIQQQVASGALPAPSDQTVYMIHFPSEKKIILNGNALCGFYGCGYHGFVSVTRPDGVQLNVAYAVLPNCAVPPQSSCGQSPDAFTNQMALASHELVEAMTDPDFFPGEPRPRIAAWIAPMSPYLEVVDLCRDEPYFFFTRDSTSYAVQKGWSDRYKQCIAAIPPPSPDNDFAISAYPSTVTARPGDTLTFMISTQTTKGISQLVNLSLAGVPTGVTPTPLGSLQSGQSTTLRLDVGSNVRAGAYGITINAVGPYASHSAGISLTVQRLFTLTLDPTTVAGGGTATGTVTFSIPVPSGVSVALWSSNPSAASVPPSVPISGMSGTFTVTTSPVGLPPFPTATITATYGGFTESATLALTRSTPRVVRWYGDPQPSSVGGTQTAVGTVGLDVPATSDTAIGLSSSSAAASVPASVTILRDQASASFTINTSVVQATTVVGLTASFNGSNPTKLITVLPPAFEGYLDLADCDNISGWAWDQYRPNTPINVDILVDGTAIVWGLTANIYRSDLVAAAKGNGVHGFRYPTPVSLRDGRPHSVAVYYSGSVPPTQLASSPRAITCNLPVDDAVVVTTSGIPSSMTPGQTATVSVTMRNTGTTTWMAAAGYKLGDASPTPGQFGPTRVLVGADVPPGGQTTFGFTLTAPTTPGTYTFGWRMLQEMVRWFGAYAPVGGYSITVAQSPPPPVVNVIWMQPGYMAGFGGAGNLVLAGSVSNVPAGTLVNLIYDQWSVGVWQSAPNTTTDSNGIWYTVIPNANFADNYSVIAVSSGVQSPGCWSGPDSNRLIWCP